MSFFEFLFPQHSNTKKIREITSSQKFKASVDRHQARSVDNLEARVAELENDLGILTLAFASLLESVNEKGLVTREEVREKIAELDVLDGFRDGKIPVSVLRRWSDEKP